MKTAHLASTLLIVVFLASCSGATPTAPTPTSVNINAVQTAAVQTVMANITQTAAAQPPPTATEMPSTEMPSTETPVALPTETAIAVPTPTLQCNDATFISDASVTDGTQMTAGQEFIKTWKVKNTGACNWTTGYSVVFGYSNPPNEKMGGLPISLTTEVAPGAEVEISLKMKAPLKSGTYSGYWKLATNNAIPFGEYLSVVIVVP